MAIKKANEIFLVGFVCVLVYGVVSTAKTHASDYFKPHEITTHTHAPSFNNNTEEGLFPPISPLPPISISPGIEHFYIIDPQSNVYSSSNQNKVKNDLNINEQLLIDTIAKKYKKPTSYIENIWEKVLVETQKSKVDLDPLLVFALIEQESSFNNKARSHANAQGLMQVIPRWHMDKLKPGDNLYDIDVSVRVGVKVLEEYMIVERGNLTRALQRYNGALSDPSARYASRVIAKHKKLQNTVLTV